MTDALRVAGLWRYPVKSMAGQPLPTLDVGPAGVLGDRVLAVAATDTGRILTGRQEPALLTAAARWLGDAVEITLPAGRTVRSTDPDADAVLSAWLGRPVALERPSDRPRTVPRSPDDDESTEWQLPAGAFVDEGALHLLDERLLATGRGWHPDGAWDVRRFRPNVLLAGPPGAPAPAGRLAVGDVLVDVTGPCRRCVMIARPQPGLPADREILRAVARRAANEFGTYATPLRAGGIRLGDPVVPAGRREPMSAEAVNG